MPTYGHLETIPQRANVPVLTNGPQSFLPHPPIDFLMGVVKLTVIGSELAKLCSGRSPLGRDLQYLAASGRSRCSCEKKTLKKCFQENPLLSKFNEIKI